MQKKTCKKNIDKQAKILYHIRVILHLTKKEK